jgi:hypothetical protein
MYEDLCLVCVRLCFGLAIGESADCASSHRGLSSETMGIRSGYAVGFFNYFAQEDVDVAFQVLAKSHFRDTSRRNSYLN